MTDSHDIPAVRPRTVTIAFWIWMAAAVGLLLLGLLSLTISGQPIRDRLADVGRSPSDIDSVLSLLRGFGVITLIVGAGVGFMTGPVCRAGHVRFRRALAVLSVVFAFVLIFSTIIGISVVPILALLSAVLLLVASVLVFRPAASGWFQRV